MYCLAYRKIGGIGTLVATHSVDTGSGNTGVRWYEITGLDENPTASQASTYSPDSSYRSMGSIGMDKFGDTELGYSVSDSSMHPAIRYTGRLASDPTSTMESENSIVEGGGPQSSTYHRWGDYSAMSIDPVDDCTFYYTNEYLLNSGSFNWSTRVGSFNFDTSGCGSPSYSISAVSSIQSAIQGTSADYALSLNPLNGYSGTVNLSAMGLPSGAASSFTNGGALAGAGSSSTLTVSTNSSISPGTYNFTVQGDDGGTVSLTPLILVVNSSQPSPDFALTSSSGTTITVAVNSSSADTITVTPSGGFTGSVSFSLSGLPRWTSASFSPNSVSIVGTGPGSSVLTISTNRRAQQGSSTLTLTATSGSLTQTLELTLVIGTTPSPDFSISATPSG
jgi:hypothetical protein